jgi:hypothetical protein
MEQKATQLRWPCVVLAMIIAATAMRPGDAEWFFDLPRLMDLAIRYNSTPSRFMGISLPFTPSPYALAGTRRTRYGPFPVWVDQAFLAFTRDPITMTAIRAVIFSTLTALGLLWLTRVLRVTPWLAVIAMLSPWMWYYSRELGDNGWNIPFTAVALAAYGDFLIRRRAWPLCLVIVCAALGFLSHLMCAPFYLALAIHLLIFETRSIWKYKWPLLAMAVVMGIVAWPYLHYLLLPHGSKNPEELSRWRGWVFPLLGAQDLTAGNMGYILEESWRKIHPLPLRYVWLIARFVTFIGFIACWAGMILAIPRARQALRRLPDAGPVAHLCLIAWATFICQTLLYGIKHVYEHPHYYSGTWIVYVLFVWLGLDAIPRWLGKQNLLSRLILPVYGLSLLFVTVLLAYQIARNGGTRDDHYSASLWNQVQVAREIESFSDSSPIDMQVPYWIERPLTPHAIQTLVGPAAGDRPTRRLVVRFRNVFPDDARIVVDNYPLGPDDAIRP